MHHDPKQLMRTYLEEVVNNGQLDLIDELDPSRRSRRGQPGIQRATRASRVGRPREGLSSQHRRSRHHHHTDCRRRHHGDVLVVLHRYPCRAVAWTTAYQSTDYRHRVQLLRPGRRPYQPLPALAPRRLRRPNRLRYLHALQMNEHGDPTKHGLAVASGY